MKIIFTTLFFFLSCNLFAQTYTYQPMNLDTSCFWVHNFYHYDGFSGAPFICDGESVTIVEKDTLINGTSYKKLSTYTSQINSMTNYSCNNYFPKGGIIFLREDTITMKIYSFIDTNLEVVIADFNKNLGDTLDIGLGMYNPIVDSITIASFNGIDRKMQWGHFGFANLYSTIEGVGTNINFFDWSYGEWGVPHFTLKCYSKGGVTLYPNNPTDSCLKKPKIHVGLKDFTKLNVNYTFQNGTLQISEMIHEDMELNVYSIAGSLVFKDKKMNSFYRKDFSNLLTSGLYIFSLRSKLGNINFKGQID